MGLMLTISGKIDRVTTEQVTPRDGQPFTSTTLVLVDWGSTEFVRVASTFEGDVPKDGDQVTMEVTVGTFVRKDGTAGSRLYAKRLLTDQAGAPLASVSGKRASA